MNLLLEIERFYLPQPDVRYLPPSQRPQRDQDISPEARLDHVLYQISLSEHLRTMQIMYRDSEDEQRLVLELREGDSNTALPTKDLMEKLLEGRCRVVALCRMCRGEDSVESLRALVDVASAYALQGQWAQVHEYMSLATQKLVQLSASNEQHEIAMKRYRGSQAAACVDCCFRVLRNHAISNRGQITTSFLREVLVELSKLQNNTNRGNQGEEEDGGDGGIGGGPNQASTRLTSELHTFFDRFLRGKRKPQEAFMISSATSGGHGSPTMDIAQKPAHKVVPSWGDVILFLRQDCDVMREWLQDMEAAMLPQNKAALHLPFRMCDEQKRGIVHPAQYAATVGKFASTLKAIAGTTLLKQLQQMKMEVPLLVNQQTGLVIDITTGNKTRGSYESVPVEDRQRQEEIILLNGGMRIVYELPVAWEEILAKHVLEADCNPVEMLRSQVLTLLGVANVFSNKLDIAEDNLKNALKQLEKIGFEMEITACELYNSIAQLMITKHRRWDGAQKTRLRKQAFEWIMASDDGKIDVKRRIEAIKKHYESKSANFVLGDIETRARNAAVKAKVKRLVVEDVDPTRKAVEAAYRYLVRAHEILETAHGAHHAAVATACLAVASVQNILGIYEESRDWLIKVSANDDDTYPHAPHRASLFRIYQLYDLHHHNLPSFVLRDAWNAETPHTNPLTLKPNVN